MLEPRSLRHPPHNPLCQLQHVVAAQQEEALQLPAALLRQQAEPAVATRNKPRC
jgi:hypothetical protein